MYGDNVLSLDRAILVVGIMDGYGIDVARLISREVRNWVVSIYTTLAFPCLLT